VECTRTFSGLRRCRLPLEARRVTPESFEAEVLAGSRLEQMHDQISVVQQHPFGLFVSFSSQRTPVLIAESELDLVGKTLHVTI